MSTFDPSPTPMAATDHLFPLGLATGPAFCNRERERAALVAHLTGARPVHAWIWGRRRHGKSSLIAQALHDAARKRGVKLVSGHIDILVVHNLAALDAALRAAIGELSAKLLPRNKRVLDFLGKAFAAFKPELSLGTDGVKLKLIGESPSAQSIEAMLTALDTAAAHYGVRVAFVIDEFQQLARLDEGRAIEGAIRAAAQKAQAVSFVFLGSERSLLGQMFERPDRPLYMLCKRLDVGRIDAEAYATFLADAAKLRWNTRLDPDALARILEVTERHPYYVNALCRELWAAPRGPKPAAVTAAWEGLLAPETDRFKAQLLDLPNMNRAALKALAENPTTQPLSQVYLGPLGIPATTMAQAVTALEARDLVWRPDEKEVRLVDPLLATYLRSL